MANVVSLGVHTPSALPFLVAEGILSEDASPDQYQWHVYEDDTDNFSDPKVDEVVSTDYCVVWSRGGVVQKVFTFEVEEQKVSHVVLTWFKSAEISNPDSGTNSNFHGATAPTISQNAPPQPTSRRKNAPRKSFTSNHATWRQDEINEPYSSRERHAGQSRALVVILSSQAHVFFLSGSSHIVNLPFEVDKALPAPWGLVLQRKPSFMNTTQKSSVYTSAPPNSFLSSQFLPSKTSPTAFRSQASKTPLFQLGGPATGSDSTIKDSLPRLFSLTNPLTELGLIVSEAPLSISAHSFSNRRGARFPYEALDSTEEVIFISSSNEALDILGPKDDALIIVVTLNSDAGVYTIWYALYSDLKPLSSLKQPLAPLLSESISKRRSSFNPGAATGTTTPAFRARDNVRESFAGEHRVGEPSAPQAQRIAPVGPGPQPQSSQNAEDAFASQVDPDFQGLRNPARESRRISSFISRADLSTGLELSNFGDTAKAQSQAGANTASLGRRGNSLGGQNERRSFGGLSSIRSRASTPGSMSRLSFLDDDVASTDPLGLPSEFLTTNFSALDFQEPLDSLPKEVILVKIQTISIDEKGPRLSASYNADHRGNPNMHVFTVLAPRGNSTNAKMGHGINLYILDRTTQELVIVDLTLNRTPFRSLISGKAVRRQVEEERYVLVPESDGVRRFNGYQDIDKIRSSSATNILSLTKGRLETELRLHHHYSFEHPFRLTVDTFKLFNPFSLAPTLSPSRREAGLKRTIKPKQVQCLRHAHFGGFVDLMDSDHTYHKLQVGLQPCSDTWDKVLEICQCVLPTDEAETLRLFWCAAHQWLTENAPYVMDIESTAICVTLFSMFAGVMEFQRALPDHLQARSSRVSGYRQELSQTTSKTDDQWALMLVSEFRHSKVGGWNETAWSWAVDGVEDPPISLRSPAKSTRAAALASTNQSLFLVEALDLAQTFLAEDLWAKGAAARVGWIGPFNDSQLRRRILSNGNVVQALHLLREESKLDVLMRENADGHIKLLAPMIAQMGHWLGWHSWDWRTGNYYELEGARSSEWRFDNCE